MGKKTLMNTVVIVLFITITISFLIGSVSGYPWEINIPPTAPYPFIDSDPYDPHGVFFSYLYNYTSCGGQVFDQMHEGASVVGNSAYRKGQSFGRSREFVTFDLSKFSEIPANLETTYTLTVFGDPNRDVPRDIDPVIIQVFDADWGNELTIEDWDPPKTLLGEFAVYYDENFLFYQIPIDSSFVKNKDKLNILIKGKSDPRCIGFKWDGIYFSSAWLSAHYDIPAPIGNIEASPTSGSTPLKVTFTDRSTGEITSREWLLFPLPFRSKDSHDT